MKKWRKPSGKWEKVFINGTYVKTYKSAFEIKERKNKMREHKSIKHESESGKEYEIFFNVDHTFDNNAGSDRDGNRGVVEHYFEDYEIESVINKNCIDIFPRMNKELKGRMLKLVKDGE